MVTDSALNNPYVGPRTFTRAQSNLFFGRESEARDLLARVVSERLLLFYAQSGAGKSSLINTRLIPQLQAEGFAVLPVGRLSGEIPAGVSQVRNPFLFNLMLSLDWGEQDPGRLAGLSLSEFLAHLVTEDGEHWQYDPDAAGPGGEAAASPELEAATSPKATQPFVLVIDQFEEIITAHPGHWEERKDFFRQVNQALMDDSHLWVVLTLREDYVAALDPYTALMFNRLRGRFYMERMGVEAALEAIRRPAELGGRPFAPGVAEQLVDNLRQVRIPGQQETIAGQYVEPVQLQVVCYQLWENLDAKATQATSYSAAPGAAGSLITAEDLKEAGDVDRALVQFYEETLAVVLADSPGQVSERHLRAWVHRELITEAGTRNLVHQGSQQTGSLPNSTVRLLQRRFLVRGETRSGDTWVELVHDRFIEPIRQSNRAWFSRNLNPIAVSAQAWHEAGKNPAKLYEGRQLADALAQIEAKPAEFGDLEQEYVEAGREAQRRLAARRQRAIMWAVSALVLVFAALSAWSLLSMARAQQARSDSVNAQATAVAAGGQAATDAAVARSAQSTSDAASTAAVANARIAATERAIAQTRSAEALKLLATQEVNLVIALTAQKPTGVVTRPTPGATRVGSPTPAPTPTRPGIPTPNQTVAAQQTQLAQVRAQQTAIVGSQTPSPKPQPVTVVPTRPGRAGAGPAPEFQALWQANARSLGAPLGDARMISPACEQAFQGGHLFWRSDTGQVYVVFDRDKDTGQDLATGTWFLGPRDWGRPADVPDSIGLSPPGWLLEPVGGLGWLWREYLGRENGRLGWAIEPEKCADDLAKAQAVERGIMYKSIGPKVYALTSACSPAEIDPRWPDLCAFRAGSP